MSTPTSNASDSGSRTAKRKNTRTASSLNSAQLERKRANDRESQRAIRARTKQHIARLEHEVRRLRSRDFNREFQHLLRCNEALEAELRQFRASVGIACNRPPACPPGGIADVSLPNQPGPEPFSHDAPTGVRFQRTGNHSARNEMNLGSARPVPAQHTSLQVRQEEQYPSPSLTYLNVPRSAAWTPQLATPASAGCLSASPTAAAPASYIPVGHAAEDVLGSVPTAAAAAAPGGLEVANEANQTTMQLRRDKHLPLTESGRANPEYAGAPFPWTANTDMSLESVYGRPTHQHLEGSMYVAGYGD